MAKLNEYDAYMAQRARLEARRKARTPPHDNEPDSKDGYVVLCILFLCLFFSVYAIVEAKHGSPNRPAYEKDARR